ncbi:hypothetical protein BT69DRAFT_417720 [Atractiella rhizophila]|nr:hypothetical protein BT69DRAFT_417720 [Atractiella rhizophila]
MRVQVHDAGYGMQWLPEESDEDDPIEEYERGAFAAGPPSSVVETLERLADRPMIRHYSPPRFVSSINNTAFLPNPAMFAPVTTSMDMQAAPSFMDIEGPDFEEIVHGEGESIDRTKKKFAAIDYSHFDFKFMYDIPFVSPPLQPITESLAPLQPRSPSPPSSWENLSPPGSSLPTLEKDQQSSVDGDVSEVYETCPKTLPNIDLTKDSEDDGGMEEVNETAESVQDVPNMELEASLLPAHPTVITIDGTEEPEAVPELPQTPPTIPIQLATPPTTTERNAVILDVELSSRIQPEAAEATTPNGDLEPIVKDQPLLPEELQVPEVFAGEPASVDDIPSQVTPHTLKRKHSAMEADEGDEPFNLNTQNQVPPEQVRQIKRPKWKRALELTSAGMAGAVVGASGMLATLLWLGSDEDAMQV